MVTGKPQEGVIAVLDIGSSKVACLIAEVDSQGAVKVMGAGHRACEGVANGVIVDMEATEKAIRLSVDNAENEYGQQIDQVIVGFECGEPESQIVEVAVDIDNHPISDADIRAVLQQAQSKVDVTNGRRIVHAFPAAFAIDGVISVKPPVGRHGKELSVAMHIITAKDSHLRDLESCVQMAELNVSRMVLSPYAAAYGALAEDEMAMGAACVDMGAGTTSISIFAQKSLVYVNVIPIGGGQITEEIARSLLTPYGEAERLKNAQGAAFIDSVDEKVDIDVPQVGVNDVSAGNKKMPRSHLRSLICRELEICFASVREQLEKSGFSGVAGKRVVLTGGVSQTEGIADLASRLLQKEVRIGRPHLLPGLHLKAQNPVFTVAVGLLNYTLLHPVQTINRKQRPKDRDLAPTGTIGRMFAWMRGNF